VILGPQVKGTAVKNRLPTGICVAVFGEGRWCAGSVAGLAAFPRTSGNTARRRDRKLLFFPRRNWAEDTPEHSFERARKEQTEKKALAAVNLPGEARRNTGGH